jgi:hypothetical protein
MMQLVSKASDSDIQAGYRLHFSVSVQPCNGEVGLELKVLQ